MNTFDCGDLVWREDVKRIVLESLPDMSTYPSCNKEIMSMAIDSIPSAESHDITRKEIGENVTCCNYGIANLIKELIYKQESRYAYHLEETIKKNKCIFELESKVEELKSQLKDK